MPKGIRVLFTDISTTNSLFYLLPVLIYNDLEEWIIRAVHLTITSSLISFGIIRDDLVTSTVECAGSGTVAIYKAGTRDLDVEKQAHS